MASVAASTLSRRPAVGAPGWTARHDRLLSDTAARLLRSDNPQGIVDDLCRRFMEFLDCQVFFNFLKTSGGGRLRLNACGGIPAEESRRIEWLEIGTTVCGCVARDGRRIIAEGIQESTDPMTDLVRSYGVQAYCCHPLLAGERVLGTLSFGTRTRPRFRPGEIETMASVANLVAIAIYRIQAETALREDVAARREAERNASRHARIVDGINRIFREALTAETEESLGAICLAVANEISGSRFGFIAELNAAGRLDNIAIDDPGWEACRISPGPDGRVLPKPMRVAGIYGRVVQEGRALFTNDPASHPDRAGIPEGHPPLASFLGVPLRRNGRVTGMMAVANRDGGYAREQTEDLEALSVAVVEAFTRKRAEEALRERDRRKDEFLAMLGHELRNPLATITAAMHVMGTPGESGGPALDRAREIAMREAAHMRRMVDDLLDVSRITQGVVNLKTETVAVGDVVRAAVESAGTLIDSLRHRLYVAIPPAPIYVCGDAVRLTQIVDNLLNNAAKYTPPGGEIHLTVERREGGAAVRVRDNGVGIPAELLPHVFDLFVQGARGPDRLQGGLGIGLTMVKRLAEMHGGRVAAESGGSGRGAEFTLWLPETECDGAGARTAAGETTAPGRRVLIVDDNADQGQLMAMLLERLGHRALVAHGGAEAIEMALASRPDVVLVDLGMPGMDGFELARRIRATEALRGVRLVAHTGYGADSDRERTREAGFDAHLVKPADLDTLCRALRG